MTETNYKEFKYKALLPGVVERDEKFQSYATAMDQAFQNSEIHNIAITGIYGAGKSSFWKTYLQDDSSVAIERKSNVGNTVTISLATFEQEESTQIASQDQNQAAIEKQIINQLLFQLDPKKISRSKYAVKMPEARCEKLLLALKVLAMAIGSMLLYFAKDVFASFPIAFSTTHWVLFYRVISAILILLPLVFFSIRQMKQLPFQHGKINFKGLEAEIGAPEKDDVLNNNMQELVYLIIAGQVQTIVFEDLDRFRDVNLFVKLRELNYLVNAQVKATNGKPIRFVYMLRDDLLESKDRTKFFDFILPIIPAIDSHNSKGKMLELFQNDETETASLPSRETLEALSLYIDDMRLLLSIRNEYEIYRQVIDLKGRRLKPDKLLALVVLKNVFPKEFSRLQQDTGYIYSLFSKIQNERTKQVEEIENAIKKRQLLQTNKKESIPRNEAQLICMYLPSHFQIQPQFTTNGNTVSEILSDWIKAPTQHASVMLNNSGYSYDFNQFIDYLSQKNEKFKILWERHDSRPIQDQVENLQEEIDSLEVQKSQVANMCLSELLRIKSIGKLEQFFTTQAVNNTNGSEEPIISDHYFNLIRFLLLEGLIDEAYPDYKGVFYKNSLGANDSIFLRSLLERASLDAHFHLDNPALVAERLKPNDYFRLETFNHELIDFLRDNNKGDALSKIINTALKNKNETDILSYLSALDPSSLTKLILCLLPVFIDTILAIISTEHKDTLLNYRICIILYEHPELLKNNVSELTAFIESNSDVLTTEGLDITAKFLDGLEKESIRFIDIDGRDIKKKIAETLAQKALVVLNYRNLAHLMSIIRQLEKHEIRVMFLNELLDNPLYELYRAEVLSSPDSLIQAYIDDIQNYKTKAELSDKPMQEMLNSILAEKLKHELIACVKATVIQLKNINDASLWDLMIQQKLVLITPENILTYWEKYNYTPAMENMLNRFYIDNNHMELPTGLANKLLNRPTIVENSFNDALQQSNTSIELLSSEMPINRVLTLIQNNKLKLTLQNFNTIVKHEDNGLFLSYVDCQKDNFLAFLQNNNLIQILTQSQITLLIDNRSLSDNNLTVLLQQTRMKISLFKIPNATPFMRRYILSNAFCEKDIPLIIETASSLDLWPEFLNLLANDTFFEQTKGHLWTSKYIDDLLSASALNAARKIDVLEHVITKAYEPHKIRTRIERIDKVRSLANVFDNKKPKIQDDDQLKIACSLEKVNIVSISKNEDRESLNFKPKAFQALLKEEE